MAGRGPCVFSDLRPVRYTDVHGDSNGPVELDRDDNFDWEDDVEDNPDVVFLDDYRKHKRKCAEAPLDLGDIEFLQFVLCHEPLLQIAWEIESLVRASTKNKSGRPRECNAIEVFLFEIAAAVWDGYKSAQRNLAQPFVWSLLGNSLINAHPDNENWRLSAKPVTRGQHYRFCKRYMNDHLLDVVDRRLTASAVEAATSIGILTPDGVNSWTHPELFVVADGTYVPAMFKTSYKDATNPKTGETKRTDPDAGVYKPRRNKEDNMVNKIYGSGYTAVLMAIRNLQFGNERIILRTGLQTGGEGKESEATAATNMYLELQQEHRYALRNVRGLAYDMALKSENKKRILDGGWIPLAKISYRPDGNPAWKILGQHEFKANKRTTVTKVVYAINGTPCILAIDGNGDYWYLPLKRLKGENKRGRTRKDGSRSANRLYSTFAVIDDELTPRKLVGATVRIRINIDDRTLALSYIPESDPWFREIYGQREDIESANSVFKSELRNGRCRAVGKHRNRFMLLMFQLRSIITALIAHHKRTGSDIQRWFGNHQLPERLHRVAKAA